MKNESVKPVMYLDVDDTLLSFDEATWRAKYPDEAVKISQDNVCAAPAASEFFQWALEHYEVRWLTAWAGTGVIRDRQAECLARALKCDVESVKSVRGFPWVNGVDKTSGVDWQEYHAGRPFVWIEDDLLPSELRTLDDHGALHCFRRCNTTENPIALLALWGQLLREAAVRP